jgi:hypothetical protein
VPRVIGPTPPFAAVRIRDQRVEALCRRDGHVVGGDLARLVHVIE